MQKIKMLSIFCLFFLLNCSLSAMVVENTQKRDALIAWTTEAFIIFLKTSGADLFNLCGIDKLTNNTLTEKIAAKKKPSQTQIPQIDKKDFIRKRLSSALNTQQYSDIFIKKIEQAEVKFAQALKKFFDQNKWSEEKLQKMAESFSTLEDQIYNVKQNLKPIDNNIIFSATAIFHLLVKIFNDANIII
jgi:hypothetical protein